MLLVPPASLVRPDVGKQDSQGTWLACGFHWKFRKNSGMAQVPLAEAHNDASEYNTQSKPTTLKTTNSTNNDIQNYNNPNFGISPCPLR